MAQNEQIKKLEADLSAITYEVGEADRLRKKVHHADSGKSRACCQTQQ